MQVLVRCLIHDLGKLLSLAMSESAHMLQSWVEPHPNEPLDGGTRSCPAKQPLVFMPN
jgi:hypothetical protein